MFSACESVSVHVSDVQCMYNNTDDSSSSSSTGSNNNNNNAFQLMMSQICAGQRHTLQKP